MHLAGRISLEVDGHRVEQQAFPGQQGRLAFAYLACERGRPVARAELAEVLWPADLPPAWDSALSAIISKLRSLLGKVGLDPTQSLTSGAGCYELRFPGTAWVDLDVAAESIHEAEVALKAGRPAAAYGPSAIPHHIARRPLFAGDEGAWVQGRRRPRMSSPSSRFAKRGINC